jgi:hypothetical protein
MRHAVHLSVQEQYLRGNTMIEKWAHAQQPNAAADGQRDPAGPF